MLCRRKFLIEYSFASDIVCIYKVIILSKRNIDIFIPAYSSLMFGYFILDIKKALLEPEDVNENDKIKSKWKEKIMAVLLSLGSVTCLLVTNSIMIGMELDFADAMFVQGVGQVMISTLIMCKRSTYFWIWDADQHRNINHVRCVLVFGAMAGSMGWFTNCVAVSFMPLGDMMTIALSNAIPTTILAAIFFKERFRMIKGISLILVITGIVLVIRPPFVFHDEPNMDKDNMGSKTNTTTSFHNNPLGIHDSYYYIGAISAVTNMIFRSIQLIAFKYLAQNKSTSSGEFVIFYIGLACLIVSLVSPFVFNGNQRIIHSYEMTRAYNVYQWVGLFGHAILSYGFLWMLIKALSLVSPVIVAFVRLNEIVLSYIVQILFFNAVPNASAIVGSCNVIIGCLLILVEDTILKILPENLKCVF